MKQKLFNSILFLTITINAGMANSLDVFPKTQSMQNNQHILPSSNKPTGMPIIKEQAAAPIQPVVNLSQNINSNKIEDKKEAVTKNDDTKKNKAELVAKLANINYNTHTPPKQLYDHNLTPANNHLPPVYFKSYYLEATFNAIKKNDYNKLRALLAKFDFLNGQNENGDTILIAAIQHHSLNSARILLTKGAYINAVNDRKRTALHYAAALGDEDSIKLLLTMGANFNLKDDQGMTALDYAQANYKNNASNIIETYIKANQS